MNSYRSEVEFINKLTGGFDHSPRKRNAPHEADAELIDLSGPGYRGDAPLLAVTTDTISEEIVSGLYHEPYQIGWMAATASLSDLAAVGAEPIGLLVSETLPDGYGHDALERLQRGISDSCRSAGTHILGGDTNFGPALSITGTALGMVSDGSTITRRGCAPGDILFASGKLGRGNGYGISIFGNRPTSVFPGGYHPRARISEGRLIRGLASSCMDTSDGLFSTLSQLAEINRVGFEITSNWEDHLDEASIALIRLNGLPSWLLLAGCHGEFELAFTVSASNRAKFAAEAAATGWNPVQIGTVTARREVHLPINGKIRNVDVAYLRDLSFRLPGGVKQYFEAMLEYEHEMMKGERRHETQ